MYTLLSQLLNIDQDPFASGGFGDVYYGSLDGSRVCIKRMQVYMKDGPQKAVKVHYWRCRFPRLPPLTKSAGFLSRGCNVETVDTPKYLTLLGVTIAPPQLVSNWMPGGDLQEYIKKNADANRLGLVCVHSVIIIPR